MRKESPVLDGLVVGMVVLHLAVCLLHGAAHSGAAVPASPATTAFIFLVILAGPPVGLAVWRAFGRLAGSWTIAVTLGAALAFGLVNHFLIDGADHVAHIAPAWRMMFGVTAVLLVITEAVGSATAAWAAVRAGRTA